MTAGELLACTETAAFFYKAELCNYEELKIHNQDNSPPMHEQQRLISSIKSYHNTCLDLAEQGGLSTLVQYREWEMQFPYPEATF